MKEQKGEQVNVSRRRFVKQAALVAGAGSLMGAALATKASAKPQGQLEPRLYRETKEWKAYYETLK